MWSVQPWRLGLTKHKALFCSLLDAFPVGEAAYFWGVQAAQGKPHSKEVSLPTKVNTNLPAAVWAAVGPMPSFLEFHSWA